MARRINLPQGNLTNRLVNSSWDESIAPLGFGVVRNPLRRGPILCQRVPGSGSRVIATNSSIKAIISERTLAKGT